jgi:DUF2953 family protein
MYIILSLILVVLFLILTLTILAIAIPLKIAFTFNSEQSTNINLIATWLNSFLKIVIVRTDEDAFYKIHLFEKEFLTKNITNKTLHNIKDYTEKIQFIRNIKPHSIDIEASYGFEDPSTTGMVCGAINLAANYLGVNVLYNNPDFSMNYNYFNIRGTVEVSTISIISTLLKLRKSNLALQPLYANK